MEPYSGGTLAIWKTESSTSSEESSDEEEDQPKGYYKMKIPIKKLYKTILTEEKLID